MANVPKSFPTPLEAGLLELINVETFELMLIRNIPKSFW